MSNTAAHRLLRTLHRRPLPCLAGAIVVFAVLMVCSAQNAPDDPHFSSQVSARRPQLSPLTADGKRTLQAVTMEAYFRPSLRSQREASRQHAVPAPQFGQFVEPLTYSTGGLPVWVASGDFNGDGKVDLSVANACPRPVSPFGCESSGSIGILLGNGDGSFRPEVSVASGGEDPRSITVADLNSDGKLDLVVANLDLSTISVLLGNGDGTFRPAANYGPGSHPVSIAVADVNGDGKLDLATADASTAGNTVSVFLGNGDGSLQPNVDYSVGSPPSSVAAGDFNGDRIADLAVVTNAGVTVLLGNGDGSFQSGTIYPAGGNPSSLTLGDFNGDGHLDLATANFNNTASVFPGNGDGTLRPRTDYPTGTDPTSVATADLNGDGKLDLIVGNSLSNTVSVLLGSGTGAFGMRIDYGTGDDPFPLTVGDLNSDGSADVVTANFRDQTVTVLLGNGSGRLRGVENFPTGNTPFSATMGDFNGDGKVDFVTANSCGSDPQCGSPTTGSVSVLLGNGDGRFQTHVDYVTGSGPLSIATADFNRDGKADLATANANANSVSVLLNRGDGTFVSHVDYATGKVPNSVITGDFNGDGNIDLALTNLRDATVSVLLNSGDGTFGSHVDYGTDLSPRWLTVADFNADGKPDLVTANCGSDPNCSTPGSVSVLLNNGDDTFRPHVDYPSANPHQSVAVGDFNGDGKSDLVTSNPNTRSVSVLLGNGDGTFQPDVDYPTGNLSFLVAVGDFNLDGTIDLAVMNDEPTKDTIGLLLGNGDGTFQEPVDYDVGEGPNYIAVGDLNGDGAPDLEIAYGGANSVGTLLNGGLPDFGLSSNVASATVGVGRSATFTLTAKSENGFNSLIALTCTVSPPSSLAPTCSLAPTTLTPVVGGSPTSILTVNTTAVSAGLYMSRHELLRLSALWLPLFMLPLMMPLVGRCSVADWTRQKITKLILLTCLLSVDLAFQSACGGSSSTISQSSLGTPLGNYTITVNASSGSKTHASSVIVTVQ